MKKQLLLLALFALSPACKKIITPTLTNSTPQLVIQGVVSDSTGPYHIYITKTNSYYEQNIYQTVSGAIVTISDSTAGVIDVLTETQRGVYTTHTLNGINGHKYLLKVSLLGKTYMASSVMPAQVKLDSIYFDYSKKNNIVPIANYQDPENIVNFYKYSVVVNGKRVKSIQTAQDILFNGKYRHTTVDADTGIIHHKDLVNVSLVSIDHPVYTFLSEAENIAYNNSNLAAPANPTSTFTGGCIGYFSAESASTKSALVK